MDASGEETLRRIVDNLRASGCEVSFSELPDAVIDVLRSSRLYEQVGRVPLLRDARLWL